MYGTIRTASFDPNIILTEYYKRGIPMKFAHTLRNYDKKNLGKDILAGLIIMAVSIPISMGYAQIAGLPAVYGLYG